MFQVLCIAIMLLGTLEDEETEETEAWICSKSYNNEDLNVG